MKKIIIGITAEPSVELLHGQLKDLVGKGYDTYLLAPSHIRVDDFCKKEGCKHIPIIIKREIAIISDFYTLIQLVGIFSQIKPDVINLGTPKISLLGMIAGWITRVKYRVYTCRGFRFEDEKGNFKRMLIFMERVTSLFSHEVFCISKSVQDLGLDQKIFSRNKSFTINKGSSNGLDLKLFEPKQVDLSQKKRLTEQYKLVDTFVFGFVGRLVDRKGLSELYEAFSIVYQQNPNFRLLVVGRPFLDQIHNPKLLKKYETHPGIVMAGFQPFELVPVHMSLMDCFVLPAIWEGFGNVLIQAAAMGLPIISTRVTGCRDAVNDGFNGILIPARESERLSQQMNNLASDSPKLAELGANGIKWSKNFDPTIIWNGLEKRYLLNL